MSKTKKTKYKTGFTMVELLVSISLFSLVITALFNLFNSALLSQEKSLNSIYLLDSASFLSERLSRSLRMARKDVEGVCIAEKANFEQTSSSNIKFLSHSGECWEFFLQDGVLMEKRGSSTQALSPDNITVQNLNFHLSGETQDDFIQPKVTISFKLKNNYGSSEEITVQTTVSQRQIDAAY